jgi:tetratricopeptide (TPR) repeat protein
VDKIQIDRVERRKRMQHYEVLRELGECYASVGDFRQAQCCYEKAVELGPHESGHHVGLGVLALQRNCLDDAEAAFQTACSVDPNCAKAYGGLAMVAQQRRDFSRAFDLYVKSLELDSDNVTLLLGLVQVSSKIDSFEQAIRALEVSLQMHPGDVSMMYTLAVSYLKAGRPDLCRDTLLNLLALDPDNVDAANLLETGLKACSRIGPDIRQ